MLRKFFCLLSVLFIFSAIAAPVYADETVFESDLQIKRWRVHFSRHRFSVDDPGAGLLVITKNTPNKKIRGGFVLFNRKFIPLRNFLRGDDTVFEKDVKLRSRNRMFVFLRGKRGASINIKVVNKSTIPLPEITFTAEPQTITIGESTTLTWSTTNADSCVIEPGIGSVDVNGSTQVSPTETTTYTITATGPGGTATSDVTVTVTYPLPTVTISADPETILLGQSSTLTWSTTNADSCVIEPGIGSVDVNGSTQILPTETTTYTITVTGASGTATADVTVTVTYPPPTVSISADLETILLGESSTLTWNSINAASASIDQGIGSVDVNGSMAVSPTENTVYTITVEGSGDTASDAVEVVVIALPVDLDYGINTDEQQGGGGLVGEIVRVLNGNTVELRSDLGFSSPHSLGLYFTATYNSRSDYSNNLGFGWTHTYSVVLDPAFDIAGQTSLKIVNQTGRAIYFTEETPGIYKGAFNERSQVKAEGGEYVWYRLDGSRYGFSTSGQLLWIDDEKGNRLTLAYDAQDQLETVADPASSRVLTFNYNANDLLESVSGPVTTAVSDGIWVTYGYDAEQNLTSVTYADGSGYTYDYTDPNDAHNLTEKKNKAGHLLNTWAYDDQDRTVGNFSRDGKGVTISYENEFQVNVTDAYGKLREYLLNDIAGRKRVSSIINGPGGAGGFPYSESSVVSWAYDEGMRPTVIESAGGTVTMYLLYDERGNPGTVMFAYGTPEQREISYTYHPDMNAVLTRTEASVLGGGDKETVWDYDDDYDIFPNESPTGLLSRVVEKGFTKDTSGVVVPYEYITTFTYNGKGQILSIDGPRPGSGDTTSFTYDPTTGDLLSITRPLIGSTGFSNYDAAGQVGRVTDINSRSKSFTYDGRGRITAVSNQADGSNSSIVYNTAGLVDSGADEDGVTKNFEYDPLYGRLAELTDHEGNYISFSYDAQGNVIEKSYYDPSAVRSNWKRFSYQDPAHNMPGKLYKETNPDDTFTQYGYDLEGNVASITDPNSNTTTYDYDPFNRLKTVTQPGSVITAYGYDVHGNLSSVTDAQSHVTSYEYDDMGRVVTTTSTDTGTVSYVYDEAGNLADKTDAKGIAVGYTYDLLNRLTNVGFPDPTQNITFTYDTGADGMGRRTGMTDPSGSTAFGYDNRGRFVEKTSTVNGYNYSLTKAFSPGGRVNSVAYPSGRTIDYTRNSTGKITGVSTENNETTTTLIDNISYLPFGPASAMDMGTGSGVANVFDELYRTTVSNPGADTERTYTYDANGNLTSINVTNDSSKNRTFIYDALNRLEHAEGPYGTIDYTYDGVGNRLTRTMNAQTEIYTYFVGTNLLQEVTGPVAYAYDANGNTAQMGGKTFVYNQNNRLVRVEENSDILGEYTYNGLGQRVIKEIDGVTTIFHYDFDGNLIAEGLPDGTIASEYLYMGTSRLARVDVSSGSIYYYLNDHLGTPQIITDASGTAVWEATNKPFGEAEVNSESTMNNNFRLPGQIFDEESGLHYNYFRDYHPGIGRYVEADPIGLKGGINLYVYANNNPVNMVDPRGEFGIPGAVIGGISGAVGGFLGGIQSGNVWAGVAGGAMGGLVGAAFGSVSEGTIGGAIGGTVGGAFGGMVSKHLSDPHATTEKKLLAAAKGAGIGLITGTIGGKLGAALKTVVGASGAAVEIAKDMITAPIALGLGLINLDSEPDTQDETSQEGINGPTIPQEYTPLPAPELEYNSNNPEEIYRDGSVTISVIGGTPPYSWSVSGTGFSLAESQTTGLSNTLFADSNACGSSTITVTDGSSAHVSFSIREPNHGQWVGVGHAIIEDDGGLDCLEDYDSSFFGYDYQRGGELWAFYGWRAFGFDSETCCLKEGGVWYSEGTPWDTPPCGSPASCSIQSCQGGRVLIPFIVYYKQWECD